MSLFQKGLTSRVSVHATRPRPISRPVRSPQRVRQPRRHNSSQQSKPEPTEGKTGPVEDASSVKPDANANANAPSKPSQSNSPSSSPPQSSAPPASSSQSAGPGTAATASGAATTPTAANAVVRPRGIREIIRASPVGQLGRWYTRVQERKPYATQLYSSIIIYLCGDLSAQFLFPSEASPPAQSEGGDGKATQAKIGEEKEERRGGYDPWRTVRHLIVGAGSSIPSYNWYVHRLHKQLRTLRTDHLLRTPGSCSSTITSTTRPNSSPS